jgi:hypothetical protein
MNKMVINHLERLFVTSDTSTIVTELEVAHPAANLIVMAAKAQEAAATAHPGVARTMALPCTDGVIDLRPLIQEVFALGDAGRVTEGAALFHAALGDALADAAPGAH